MLKNQLDLLQLQNYLVLDMVAVGILVLDEDAVLFANTAFSRAVGLSLRELQASSLSKIAGDAWVDFSLGQSWADALPWPMPNGGERWFEVSLQGSTVGGRTVHIATCTDVTSRMRAEGAEANILQMMTEIIEGYPVGTLVIDENHLVTHWNRACEVLTEKAANDIVGTDEPWRAFYAEKRPMLSDWVMEQSIDEEAILKAYGERIWRSSVTEGTFESEQYFPHLGQNGRWLHFAATPLRNANDQIVGAIETLIDVTTRKKAEEELRMAREAAEHLVEERTRELREAKTALEADFARQVQIEAELQRRLTEVTMLNTQLHDTQERLVQSQQQLLQNEKLASIGQLAAGVAHEINNPIGYVFSNIGTLQKYLTDLLKLIDACTAAEPVISDEATRLAITKLRKEIDLEYLKTDVLDLMNESREGIERVRKIVQDLKDFSHADASTEWQWSDLQRGLESTLNIVNNEIKYKADVVREFGDIPPIQCMPSQLNQVFMNLLVNAAHAVKEGKRGCITVRTGMASEEEVWIEISDTGTGMTYEIKQRIFDPFFTTKPVGKGTGLGLSLSYGIVKKHNGKIDVQSTLGEGTTFRITLPIQQPETTEGGGQ